MNSYKKYLYYALFGCIVTYIVHVISVEIWWFHLIGILTSCLSVLSFCKFLNVYLFYQNSQNLKLKKAVFVIVYIVILATIIYFLNFEEREKLKEFFDEYTIYPLLFITFFIMIEFRTLLSIIGNWFKSLFKIKS